MDPMGYRSWHFARTPPWCVQDSELFFSDAVAQTHPISTTVVTQATSSCAAVWSRIWAPSPPTSGNAQCHGDKKKSGKFCWENLGKNLRPQKVQLGPLLWVVFIRPSFHRFPSVSTVLAARSNLGLSCPSRNPSRGRRRLAWRSAIYVRSHGMIWQALTKPRRNEDWRGTFMPKWSIQLAQYGILGNIYII